MGRTSSRRPGGGHPHVYFVWEVRPYWSAFGPPIQIVWGFPPYICMAKHLYIFPKLPFLHYVYIPMGHSRQLFRFS